jgi:AraC-like DNA-binding protein/mannose-6-phosphate isomerase-like protein (cupin superfamily)
MTDASSAGRLRVCPYGRMTCRIVPDLPTLPRMHRVSPWTDGLSRTLGALQVRSTVFCRSDFHAPWGFRVSGSPFAKFHLILSGESELFLDRQKEPVQLRSGDVVLLPHGTAHMVRDRSSSPVRNLEQILADHPVDGDGRMTYGGNGTRTTIVCGAFETEPASGGVLNQLPPLLVADSRSTAMTGWIEPMSRVFLRDEVAPPGASVILAKVADVFLTEVLRQFLASSQSSGFTPAQPIADSSIAEALALVLDRPEAPWTVDGLARTVGMSRTAFSSGFREHVGDSPMSYLTKVRLSRGAGLLSTSSQTVRQVARRVGYDNEASFSKAFKRLYGQSPGGFRSRQGLNDADGDASPGQPSTSRGAATERPRRSSAVETPSRRIRPATRELSQ